MKNTFKFQVMTYRRKESIKVDAFPFVAIAIGLPWPLQGDHFYGNTADEARDKLVKAAQAYLEAEYTNLIVTEVELQIERSGRALEFHPSASTSINITILIHGDKENMFCVRQ